MLTEEQIDDDMLYIHIKPEVDRIIEILPELMKFESPVGVAKRLAAQPDTHITEIFPELMEFMPPIELLKRLLSPASSCDVT